MKTRAHLEAIGRSAALIIGKIATLSDEEINDYVDETEAFELMCQLDLIEEDMP